MSENNVVGKTFDPGEFLDGAQVGRPNVQRVRRRYPITFFKVVRELRNVGLTPADILLWIQIISLLIETFGPLVRQIVDYIKRKWERNADPTVTNETAALQEFRAMHGIK